MELTRETFGNISPASQNVFYILAALTMVVFCYGVWKRFVLWKKGLPIDAVRLIRGRLSEIWGKVQPGLNRLLVDGLGQKRVRGRGLASWAHLLLFAGFMILFAGTTMLEVDHLASAISKSLHFHQGTYYVIYEFTLDVFGVLFLLGCIFFAFRRLRLPPSAGHRATDWVVLGIFIALGVTGFVLEGLRIRWQQPPFDGAICSPVGFLISKFFDGLTVSSARSAHWWLWWTHSFLVFFFIGMIPYTRLMHFIAGPLNLFFAQPVLGRMNPVSAEDVESSGRFGASDIAHFNRQQLLSLDACMECGRCEDACPATATGKPLSPKDLVQDLKALMSSSSAKKLHEDVIRAETLWSCTSCSACVQVCPVRIDPLTLIFDMRRNLVGEGGLGGTAAATLRKMQSSANPWGFPQAERSNWAEGLQIPSCKENPGFDVLYWIGCAGSYDRRAQKVTRSVVKLLQHAGVNFAILKNEEKCNGESARRVGDEFLFQELAQANIETLARYKVRKILTHCPHCLNTFMNDYPQFGGQYEVVHHTTYIEQLQAEGRLRSNAGAEARPADSVTYHDPCYLARVNDIHQAPRDVLMKALETSSSKPDIREMARNRTKTSCCGAGGGRMWMEEDPKQRVSTLRAREALGTGAKTVAVGCPFCLTMMSDGVASQNAEARVLDVAELLVEQLGL